MLCSLYIKVSEEEGKAPVTIDENELPYEHPAEETQEPDHNIATRSDVSDSTKSKICSTMTGLSGLAIGSV